MEGGGGVGVELVRTTLKSLFQCYNCFFRSQFAIIGDSLLEQLRAILVGDEEEEKEEEKKDEDKMKKEEDVSRVFVMARQEELVRTTFLQNCLSLLLFKGTTS